MRSAAVCWIGVLLVACVGAARADVINFESLSRGYYSGTEGDPNEFLVSGVGGLGPVKVFGRTQRPALKGRNAAVVFDSANPTGNDFDLGSPNETCDVPGPGRGRGGEKGRPFENCPSIPIGKGLIVGENLTDANGDGLVDDPNDEGSRFNNPQFSFDFSALGAVTIFAIDVLDIEPSEAPAHVQLFDPSNVLIGFFQLPGPGKTATGNNGLARGVRLGPTPGVARMEVVLMGSGMIDNIVFDIPRQPAVDIRKQEEGPDTRVFPRGAKVVFEIVVTNTGNEPLTGVQVTDAQVPGCARVIGDLAPGAQVAYTCEASAVVSSFTNEACVGARGATSGTQVGDCDPSRVEIIAIDIRKQAEGPDKRTFPSGSNVPFEIVVTNTGDEDLEAVEVTDVQVPGCARSIGPLAAGASTSYVCTAANVTVGFTNEACVSGRRSGVTVRDCDPSTVEIETPPGGGQGCTPGYWKQKHHFRSWTTYKTTDRFEIVFGVPYFKTLLQALGTGGGQEKALGRHAVAALLNAAHPGVGYAFTPSQVIGLVQSAWASGDFERVKNVLAAENERGCPLN